MTELTEKQLRFIDEYLKDGNATQAAIRSGYSAKTAYRAGYNNVKNSQIKEKIDEHRNEIARQLRQQFTGDAVIARKVLFDIMNDKTANESVRAKAAIDFLDRAGFKPAEKIEHAFDITKQLESISDEELDKMLEDKN